MTLAPALPRILPFLLFMAFIAVEEGIRFVASHGVIQVPSGIFLYLYPLKAVTAAAAVVIYRKGYHEIDLAHLKNLKNFIISVATGGAVFILWINLDWVVPGQPHATAFNPNLFTDPSIRFFMTAMRITGAVVVVPVIEELFWRSFLIRYLLNHRFYEVPVGSFSWFSFIAVSILFGLEHHFFVAGLAAGIIYNLLLYFTKSIAHCIVAHAVTNLILAVYVLANGAWHYW